MPAVAEDAHGGQRGEHDTQAIDEATQRFGETLEQVCPRFPSPVLAESASRSTPASRSSSPTKTMKDLVMADPPIKVQASGFTLACFILHSAVIYSAEPAYIVYHDNNLKVHL